MKTSLVSRKLASCLVAAVLIGSSVGATSHAGYDYCTKVFYLSSIYLWNNQPNLVAIWNPPSGIVGTDVDLNISTTGSNDSTELSVEHVWNSGWNEWGAYIRNFGGNFGGLSGWLVYTYYKPSGGC